MRGNGCYIDDCEFLHRGCYCHHPGDGPCPFKPTEIDGAVSDCRERVDEVVPIEAYEDEGGAYAWEAGEDHQEAGA